MNPNKKEIQLSVVIPIFNEYAILPELHQRLSDAARTITSDYELIFVNDGSSDDSLSRLIELTTQDRSVHYLNLSRNFGHQIAVTAGLEHTSGEAIIIIDGDLQDPPELIPELYRKYKEGFDVVYAQRIKRKGEVYFKKITARAFYRILKKITRINIPLDTGDFRLISRRILGHLSRMQEQNKFLRGQIAWLGFNQCSVPFEREERKFGKTNYSLGKMLKLAMDGVTSFSDAPLAFVTRLGIMISFVSVLIIFYAAYSHFILDRTITGWTSLIISISFIGGVQLLSIGIIGEYISRINKNVLNRPLYLVESTDLMQHKRADSEFNITPESTIKHPASK